MKAIKNIQNKTVCHVDEKNRIIEIKKKGCVTIIIFMKDGTAKVINK